MHGVKKRTGLLTRVPKEHQLLFVLRMCGSSAWVHLPYSAGLLGSWLMPGKFGTGQLGPTLSATVDVVMMYMITVTVKLRVFQPDISMADRDKELRASTWSGADANNTECGTRRRFGGTSTRSSRYAVLITILL